MSKLSLKDVNVNGKKVIMRVDFNVPLDDKRQITDDTRVRESLASIRYIIEHGGSLILMSHLGRPKGGPEAKYSMAPVAKHLEKLLGKCDAIKECIVKEMGKKIGTVVCCEDDKQQQVKAFVTELNRTLPMYKRISVVECSAEPLPRNALGKLLRK